MSDTPLVKMDGATDPDRCQGVTPNKGQCTNKKFPGNNDYCKVHGGTPSKAEANRQYRLVKWRNRLSEFADSPEIKSLREEIGIVRLSLEEVLNKCEHANDLIIYSDKILKMVQIIDALVVSCHKMEEKTGSMLDKTKISQILDVILAAVTSQITDPDVLEVITAQIEVNLCQTLQISLSTASSPVSIEQAQQMLADGQLSTV